MFRQLKLLSNQYKLEDCEDCWGEEKNKRLSLEKSTTEPKMQRIYH